MKSNKQETGIAVIGAGGIGNLRAHSCKQITQVDYIAVCDIEDKKLSYYRQGRMVIYSY